MKLFNRKTVATAFLLAAIAFTGACSTQEKCIPAAAESSVASHKISKADDAPVKMYKAILDTPGVVRNPELSQLVCAEGLRSVNIPFYSDGSQIDGTTATVDTEYDSVSTGVDKSMITVHFNGLLPEVVGGFLESIDAFKGSDGKYVTLTDTYPVVWLPGMDKAFIVNSLDFTTKDLSSITLCIR